MCKAYFQKFGRFWQLRLSVKFQSIPKCQGSKNNSVFWANQNFWDDRNYLNRPKFLEKVCFWNFWNYAKFCKTFDCNWSKCSVKFCENLVIPKCCWNPYFLSNILQAYLQIAHGICELLKSQYKAFSQLLHCLTKDHL